MIFKKFASYNKAKLFFLVDFSNIAYKSHFIYPDDLEYGFALQMINILNAIKFSKGHIIWCLDGYSKDRREIYPDYKAQRSRAVFDKTKLYQLISLWPQSTLAHHKELEADDVIAKLIRENPENKYVIVSGDRDLWALKQYPNCSYYDCNKNMKTIITKQHLKDKFDLYEWRHITLYKALFGDASDNIKAGKPFRCPTKFLMPCIGDDIDRCVAKIKERYPDWSTELMEANLKIVRFMDRPDVVISSTPIKKDVILDYFMSIGLTNEKIIKFFSINYTK